MNSSQRLLLLMHISVALLMVGCAPEFRLELVVLDDARGGRPLHLQGRPMMLQERGVQSIEVTFSNYEAARGVTLTAAPGTATTVVPVEACFGEGCGGWCNGPALVHEVLHISIDMDGVAVVDSYACRNEDGNDWAGVID